MSHASFADEEAQRRECDAARAYRVAHRAANPPPTDGGAYEALMQRYIDVMRMNREMMCELERLQRLVYSEPVAAVPDRPAFPLRALRGGDGVPR